MSSLDTTENEAGKFSFLVVAAIIALSIVSEVGVWSIPLLVGEVVTLYKVEEGTVGLFISLQIVATAIAAIVIAPHIHKINRRNIAIFVVLALTAGHIIAALGTVPAAFLVSRLTCGAAEGLGIATAAAVAGESRKPDRLFSLIWIVLSLTASMLYLAIPRLAAEFGPRAAFAVLAAVTIATLGIIPRLPARSKQFGLINDPIVDRQALLSLRNLALLQSIALIAICNNGFFFFIVGIAAELGISNVRMGEIMVFMAFFATLGPAAAHLVSNIVTNRTAPISIAVLIGGIGAFTLTHTDSAIIFVISSVAATTSYVFALPFILGLASELVSGGRLAAAMRGAQNIGTALTPAISGVILLSGFGYAAIGNVALLCALSAVALIIYAGRSHASPSQSSTPS